MATVIADLVRLREMARTGRARALRERAGLSVAELAAAVGGVAPSTISRWETGRRTPRQTPALSRYGAVLAELERLTGP